MSAPQRPFPVPHLVIVSTGEALVLMAAMLRAVVLPGAVDFSKQAHVVWFAACFVLAALAPAAFVLRSVGVAKRERDGENVSDEWKQVLIISLGLLIPAAIVALAGPAIVEVVLE